MKQAITVFALSLGLVVPAVAGEQLQVVTSESLAIGGAQGTFAMSGDLTDSGITRFTLFFLAGSPTLVPSTEHVIQVYRGAAGTLTVQNECLTVAYGAGLLLDTCQAVVMDGTGAYVGRHGNGRCSGVLNFSTGLATRICQLRLNN